MVLYTGMKYTIGLDVGTSSVGWAVVEQQEDGKKNITRAGVRLFDSAENQKNGSSLALPRRTARSVRRILRRKKQRLHAIRNIFIQYGLLTREGIENIHNKPSVQSDQYRPYRLRKEGLSRKLTPEELYIAIYHIAKRRGYRSNRKEQIEEDVTEKTVLSKKTEDGKVLKSTEANKILLQESGKTVGEFLLEKAQQGETLRNKSDDYKNTFLREMLLQEVKKILDTQVSKKLVSTDCARQLEEVVSFQRHYAQGDRLKNMVGMCTFEKEEMRASKATYSFQYFVLLQSINNLRIKNAETRKENLTEEERKKCILLAHEQIKIDYKKIRKILNLAPQERFATLLYSERKQIKNTEGKKEWVTLSEEESIADVEKKVFVSMKTYHTIKRQMEEVDESYWRTVEKNTALLDFVGDILTLYKEDGDVKTHLTEIGIPEAIQTSLLSISPTKFGHLSCKALQNIIPYLEKGKTYNEACICAGYTPETMRTGVRTKKLPPLQPEDHHTLTNPVVRRAVAQTMKVVNAIITEYGSPSTIHIELARDLSKDLKERRTIQTQQLKNQERNEDVCESLEALGKKDPRGGDILRFKLWEEQGCKCAYSGKTISEHRLFEDGYTDIDHIIPFSRSFDDSYYNKVLVLKDANQNKRNQTPFEFFGEGQAWKDFEERIRTLHLHPKKTQNLLTKKAEKDSLTTRSLNDTRFISRFLKNYIEQHLEFQETAGKKQHVFTVNGQATAYLRRRWGFEKDREESNKHHAQDAVVVALADKVTVDRIMWYAKIHEITPYLQAHKDIPKDPETENNYETKLLEEAQALVKERHEKHTKHFFPIPWDTLREDVGKTLADIFVSRAPSRKGTGEAHEKTIYGKIDADGRRTKRIALAQVTPEDIENMYDKEGGARAIYEVVKTRLEKYDGDAKKAFSEPLYITKKKEESEEMVPVQKIKILVPVTGKEVNKGRAFLKNGDTVRIDVFSKPNKKGKKEFYVVPVYVHDITTKKLPIKYFPAKGKNETGLIDETFSFEHSFYPNDLIKCTKKEDDFFGYYNGYGIASGAISCTQHDSVGGKAQRNIGVKTLDNIEKYAIDVLGTYHKIGQEKRQEFHVKKPKTKR